MGILLANPKPSHSRLRGAKHPFRFVILAPLPDKASKRQSRSKAKLDFHFNASLSAVTFAKLEARHQSGNGDEVFSMASLKRRAFNQHLVDRICEHLANGQSLEKSSPDYEALCNYGIIADEAA